MELTEIEQYFKDEYSKLGTNYDLNNLKKDFTQNGRMFKYEKLYNRLLTNSIHSEKFFESNQPIEIFRHLRYLPKIKHSHDHFELIYVFSGTVENEVNKDPLKMKAGDVCILSPSTIHSISSFTDDAIIYNVLIRNEIFETQFIDFAANKDNSLSNFFSLSLFKNIQSYIFFDTRNDTNLKNFMSYIVKESESDRKYRYEMINNLVSAFFILLLRRHEECSLYSRLFTNVKSEKELEIIKYIQNNFVDISLSKVSEEFSYSERQISRIIKSFTNYSFTEFLANIKLSKAKRLIQKTNMSIESIAFSVGYIDQSNFYRQFKKKFGTSPASCRELYNKKTSQ
ncbi:AraC family transcriptional regulator [Candidatus Enterococcus murrayae]|uniref:Helix-turn-helix domain-containing protein n=1 Tax=Candidatus Enterococcus murrayae TaxID=2815321 RepID=A0ABS3HIM0_9ENTE|nr:AraC family transcriptional regulator [Enterococcus sp. MJM16]MBO0452852.1 helix-turn-helix domain-containing protein [Enterococcus sp. MJM16]